MTLEELRTQWKMARNRTHAAERLASKMRAIEFRVELEVLEAEGRGHVVRAGYLRSELSGDKAAAARFWELLKDWDSRQPELVAAELDDFEIEETAS